MTRSRLILAVASLGIVLLGVGAWLVMPPSAICKANYDRLAPGMSLEHVEEILGGPARDESTGILLTKSENNSLACSQWVDMWQFEHRQGGWHEWVSDTSIVGVKVSDIGKMFDKDYLDVHRRTDGPWAKLRSWLKL